MRTRAHAARGAAGTRGFTLLELILVLFLAGLLAALVAPSVSRTLESSRLLGGAAEVRATLSLARTLSASAGRERSVLFDLEKGEYGISGESRRRLLPEGVRFRSLRVGDTLVEPARLPADAGPRVRFFPDGSAEETEVVLTATGGGTRRVVVDPLTGLAEAGT
ncbi:MAG: GspH/FimT family pseudopilin [Deltaproteobacteria bacterium]